MEALEELKRVTMGVEEGVVEYRLFFREEDPTLDAGARAARRLARCLLWEDLAQRIVGDYEWNDEGFTLHHRAPRSDGQSGGPGRRHAVVHGRTRFGDCYQDEWLVVHILVEISRQFPDVIAQVVDDDGEFLLIEAADHLPPWVTPENSANACFIRAGELHLLLPEQWPGGEKPDEATSLARGLAMLESAVPPTQYIVNSRFKAQIEGRLECFYAQQSATSGAGGHIRATAVETLNHVQRCYLPANLAHIVHKLQSTPRVGGGCSQRNWVAHAASMFYLRDPDQVRVANRLTHFAPKGGFLKDTRSTDTGTEPDNPLVLVPVRFSRMAFARLLRQKYFAPKKFGGLVPPDPSSAREAPSGDSSQPATRPSEADFSEYVQASVGMKLTCAFEMLVHAAQLEFNPTAGPSPVGGDSDRASDVEESSVWKEFEKQLEANVAPIRAKSQEVETKRRRRFFRDNISNLDETEGSSGSQREVLLQTFLETLREVYPKWGSESRSVALKNLAAVDKHAANSGGTTNKGVDGGGAWLELRPEQLDDMLKQYEGVNADESGFGQASDGNVPAAAQGLPQNIFDGIQNLLRQESSFEGVEHRDEGVEDDGRTDDEPADNGKAANDSSEQGDVELDFQKIMRLVQAGAAGEPSQSGGSAGSSNKDAHENSFEPSNTTRPFEAAPSRQPGEQVYVGGLVSDAGKVLNGTQGRIVQFDSKSRRYIVQLAGGLGRKKFRAVNLRGGTAGKFAPSVARERNCAVENSEAGQRPRSQALHTPAGLATHEVAVVTLPERSPTRRASHTEPDSDDEEVGTASGSVVQDATRNRFMDPSSFTDSRDESDVFSVAAAAEAMDAELSETNIAKSFVRQELHPSADGESEDLQEVSLDVNLVQNLLKSYNLQGGLAGPASTLLGGLGIALPDDADDREPHATGTR